MKLKENEKLKINNFIYHELPNKHIVVQTKYGIVRITNDSMINFVKLIDNSQEYRYYNFSDIREYFGPNTEKALDFLIEYKIMDYKVGLNFKLKGVSVLSNDMKFLKTFTYVGSEDFAQRDLDINFYDLNESINIQYSEDMLICCFLNPYDRNLAKEIVRSVKSNNNVLLMSYTYNNNVYIDNLYRDQWKNPCHLCNIGNLETQLRMQIDGNLTYQQIIDALYHEDVNFKTGIKLSNKDILNLTTEIYKKFDQFIFRDNSKLDMSFQSEQNINESTLIDLISNKTIRDFSIHWELCDCYE
ncbi:MAG TPA: hypothetical protein DG757_09495 [Bacillus sp. (in: Bacteria)]|nr:hypothetical protein [Bacillus sp. (in: firmicutes)]